MTTTDDVIWAKCRKALLQMTADDKDEAETYIKPLQAKVVGKKLRIYAPNLFIKERIELAYISILHEIVPQGIEPVVVVGASREDSSQTSTSSIKDDKTSNLRLEAPSVARNSKRPPRKALTPADIDYESDRILQGKLWSDDLRAIVSDLAVSTQ